jgi:hypothetical protein
MLDTIKKFLPIVALATGLCVFGQTAIAQTTAVVPQSEQQIRLSYAPLVTAVAPAVVNIYTRKTVAARSPQSPLFSDPFFQRFFGNAFPGTTQRRQENSLGSGVIVSNTGLVMVIIVLLNVEFTWAMPAAIFFRSLRLRTGALAIVSSVLHFARGYRNAPRRPANWQIVLLLLTSDRAGRALAGARIRVGTLTPNRQALTMTQAAIATKVHQTLNVHRDFTAQVTLYRIVPINHFADPGQFVFPKLIHALGGFDGAFAQNLYRSGRANACDVSQRDQHSLVGRDVNAGDTCHVAYSFKRV